MAKYRAHLIFNCLVGFPIAASIFLSYISDALPIFSLFSIAFLVSTLLLSPDADLAHSVRLLSVRGLLTLPFRPYSYFFSHRGISHMPVIGTCTRLAYCALLLCILFFLTFRRLPQSEEILALYSFYPYHWKAAVAGIAYADICHILIDGKKP